MKNWFQRTFLPMEENGFQPAMLQKAAMIGMVVLVLISFSIANLQSLLWFSSEWLVSTILPAVVTDATNEARTAEGYTPLVRNSLLDQAAELKAEDMAAKGYFAHWSPEGTSPWHWFQAAGYAYAHAGENLAVHFTDSTVVVEAWLKSPTHRANIMNAKYTEIGIGTARGTYEGYDTVFVVQMFGTPTTIATMSIEPETEVLEPTASEPETVEAPPVVAGADADTEVSVTDEGTVVYESFASTVAAGSEAVIASVEGKQLSPPSFIMRVLTSPRLMLQLLYSIIGLLVVIALIVSIIVEWRRQHPVQMAYASAMLLFMVALFQLHLLVSSGVAIA